MGSADEQPRDSSSGGRRAGTSPITSAIPDGGGQGSRGSMSSDGDNSFVRESKLDEEELLQWATLEKLPTYNRLRTAVLQLVGEDGTKQTEKIDVTKLSPEQRQQIVDRIGRLGDDDDQHFLRKLRARLDKVGIDLPRIEVRFDHLSTYAQVHMSSRAIPSILNFFKSILELPLLLFGATKKSKVNILSDISGILKPARFTLLLGPPESGKTTLLRALAARLDDDVEVSGEVTYNGHHTCEFFPRRTSAYITQNDLQAADLTVRENLNFYSRVQGVGHRYDMLTELSKRERHAGIIPEADTDIYLKTTSLPEPSTNLATDYVMRLMGLDICADTRVGNNMRGGISGGQKKRVSTAEILVGPAKALFMDELSTGLDSSTTFQIVKMLRQIVHSMDSTILVSLLQPAPETYELFDDIILISEGQIVYQGPTSFVLDYFASMGFRCPERKAHADFLQEVTSCKDQRQYWADKSVAYEYISVPMFVDGFRKFHVGRELARELAILYDKSQSHPDALVYQKYALSKLELLKACFAREIILMKRNMPVYISKVLQIAIIAFISGTIYLRTTLHRDSINHATVYMGALFFCLLFIMTAGTSELLLTVIRLPIFFKEKELCLYPAWSLVLPMFVLRIPWTVLETGVYLFITYFTTGFAPEASRFFRLFLVLFLINQATIGMFRFVAALARTRVSALHFGLGAHIATICLGGFILSRDNIPPWWKWASWCSTAMYGQEAVSMNEFLATVWDKPYGDTTLGIATLRDRGLETRGYWVWVDIAALVGFIVFFNILFILALTYLKGPAIVRSSRLLAESVRRNSTSRTCFLPPARLKEGPGPFEGFRASRNSPQCDGSARVRGSMLEDEDAVAGDSKGILLPFRPLSISFDQISYSIDMPETMKEQGFNEDKLKLLSNVSGAFRPGVLTALVGVSGAGKTTLMDVLAGRKSRGYTDGKINISGYVKQQVTFSRICGYCEQSDIHSPNVTVYESLIYSAWMRLPPEVGKATRLMFVEEVMSLVELDVIRDLVVGMPGESGLSIEQRKRLTIAVELVANPSIIFMDEPTSGLDARAAAIVMRAVRNIGDTGRTVVCTIHQPSIDIFEAFDELLLLKEGGRTIYAGPLGEHSCHLVAYFEAISGVPKIKHGQNPATWMLDVSSTAMESKLRVDFAQIFVNSPSYSTNQDLVQQLSSPVPHSKDLEFPSVYAQSFLVQCLACCWKMSMSYWRNTSYNGVRILFVAALSLFFGSIFWGAGKKRATEQEVFNLMGVCFAAVSFIGMVSSMTVQPVVTIERLVYYRERGAGMYSPLAYTIAQFFIEWPYMLLMAVLHTAIVYPMIQFEWQYAKVLWFAFFTFFSLLFYVYWGMITVAVSPNPQLAAILVSSFFALFNLCSGYTIVRTQIPVWWRWLYWSTPAAWTLYGLIASQLGDVETIISIPDKLDANITVREFVSDYIGFEFSFLKWVALENVGLIVLLGLLFAFFIKYLNFQRR